MMTARNPSIEHPSAQQVWTWLADVPDPEIPVISLVDLGIIRNVAWEDEALVVTVTPTYSGCPATTVINLDIERALNERGIETVTLKRQLSPAWTTDWISQEGREKLKAYGIAPPAHLTPEVAANTAMPIKLFGRIAGERIACPRCASERTERLSAFGSTACKALYRCMACREPFEHFKPI